MTIAEMFVTAYESKLVAGKFVAGRYDMEVLADVRSVWAAHEDNSKASPCFTFSDGSKCLYNKDYQDWFLI